MGLFGAGDTELVSQYAWKLLNATSFASGEVYSGVRFEKEREDNGLNLPMVIIKQVGILSATDKSRKSNKS